MTAMATIQVTSSCIVASRKALARKCPWPGNVLSAAAY